MLYQSPTPDWGNALGQILGLYIRNRRQKQIEKILGDIAGGQQTPPPPEHTEAQAQPEPAPPVPQQPWDEEFALPDLGQYGGGNPGARPTMPPPTKFEAQLLPYIPATGGAQDPWTRNFPISAPGDGLAAIGNLMRTTPAPSSTPFVESSPHAAPAPETGSAESAPEPQHDVYHDPTKIPLLAKLMRYLSPDQALQIALKMGEPEGYIPTAAERREEYLQKTHQKPSPDTLEKNRSYNERADAANNTRLRIAQMNRETAEQRVQLTRQAMQSRDRSQLEQRIAKLRTDLSNLQDLRFRQMGRYEDYGNPSWQGEIDSVDQEMDDTRQMIAALEDQLAALPTAGAETAQSEATTPPGTGAAIPTSPAPTRPGPFEPEQGGAKERVAAAGIAARGQEQRQTDQARAENKPKMDTLTQQQLLSRRDALLREKQGLLRERQGKLVTVEDPGNMYAKVTRYQKPSRQRIREIADRLQQISDEVVDLNRRLNPPAEKTSPRGSRSTAAGKLPTSSTLTPRGAAAAAAAGYH